MEKKVIRVWALFFGLTAIAFATEDEHSHPHPRPEAVQPTDIVIPTELWERLSFSALMELETFAAESDGVSESDLTLATLELLLDADVVEGLSAHVGLLWEEDDTEENMLDEGYLTYGATDEIPFYLTAGKMYLPFGFFKSEFISDPLTLELGEIRESAGMVGFAADWLDLNVGAFNGDFDEAADNSIDNAFASISITAFDGFTFGAYWLSDLLEADGLADLTASALDGGFNYKDAGGAGAFFHAHLGPVRISAEYLAAIETINFPGGALRPEAYNLEGAVSVSEQVTVALKIEGSTDFYADLGSDKWADEQVGMVISYAANDYVTLSAEYLHAEGLDDDASADQVTAQVSLVL